MANHIHRGAQSKELIFCRVGWENALGFLLYSKRFRATRKLFSKTLGSNLAVSRFNPLQEVEGGRFLLRVLENPDALVEHIRKYVPFVT